MLALSYKSFEKLGEFFSERFKIELVPAQRITVAVEAIETRNISVHNRCVINARYAERTKCEPARIGSLRKLWISDIEEIDHLLAASVVSVDRQARSNLKLRGVRFARPVRLAAQEAESSKKAAG